MKQTLSLKKSLLVSGAAMLLCGAMLAGTTFAWFSDTATSAENTITAGTLDVELQYKNGDAWEDATDHSFFTESTKWEPGMLVVSEPFRIANVGSRDLKYSVSLETEDYLGERKLEEGENRLSTVISHTLVKSKFVTDLKSVPQETTRQDMWDSANDPNGGDDSYVPTTSILVKNPEKTSPAPENSYAELAMVLYWKPTAEDSDYNVEDNTQPYKIKFHLHVFATQAVAEDEKDSVDNTYDKNAPVPNAAEATVQSQEIKQAINEGVTQSNQALADKKLTGVEVGELVYNPENYKYEADVTFTGNDGKNHFFNAAIAILNLIDKAVEAQKDNIATVSIAGVETEITEDFVATEVAGGAAALDKWYGEGLMLWMMERYNGDIMGFLGLLGSAAATSVDFAPMNGQTCDVVITDKEGNPVTYSLTFDIVDA